MSVRCDVLPFLLVTSAVMKDVAAGSCSVCKENKSVRIVDSLERLRESGDGVVIICFFIKPQIII